METKQGMTTIEQLATDTMTQTKHVLSAITKPCGGRFRLTILADGWVIDRYSTSLPVVYALIGNRTRRKGSPR